MQKKEVITTSSRQTQQLGGLLAQELRGGEIICLSGDLGAGKTTFTQGLLKGLGAKGPYTSPTFLVIKNYQKEIPNLAYRQAGPKSQIPNKSKVKNLKKYQIPDTKYRILNIYHIDAYRVGAKEMLNLGWEELVADKNNILIIEWPERIKKIIPQNSVWINFEWLGEKQRKLTIK